MGEKKCEVEKVPERIGESLCRVWHSTVGVMFPHRDAKRGRDRKRDSE